MSEKLVTTLTVSYEAEKRIETNHSKNKEFADASSFVIVLEQMSSELSSVLGAAQIKEDILYFKCFPSHDITIKASLGTATIASEKRIDSITDIVSFGGTSSSLLKYPNATEVTIEPLGECIREVVALKDESGFKKDDIKELKVVTPSFEFNQETNSIEVFDGFTSIEIYGHCLVHYKSEYSLVEYRPNFNGLIERTSNDKRKKGKSDKLYAGTIYAYRLFNKKTYAVSQDVDLDKVKSPEWARVYSKIVLDEDGSHESPEGWPTNKELDDGVNFNKNNGNDPKPELDPDMSFTDTRVHLLITIDMFGNLNWDHQQHWLLDPFDDPKVLCEEKIKYNPKKPEFFLKFASPPGGAKTSSAEEFIFEMMNTTWRDIFIIPDKAKVKDKILDYYGEMKGIEEA